MGGPFEELDLVSYFCLTWTNPTFDKLCWAYENMRQKSLRCDLLTCGEHLQFIPSFYYWNFFFFFFEELLLLKLKSSILRLNTLFLTKNQNTNKTGHLIDLIIGLRKQLFFSREPNQVTSQKVFHFILTYFDKEPFLWTDLSKSS